MRVFEILDNVRRLRFSIIRRTHCACVIFGGNCYSETDRMGAIAEFEANEELDQGRARVNKTHEVPEEISSGEDHECEEDHEEEEDPEEEDNECENVFRECPLACLALSRGGSGADTSRSRGITLRCQFISIPDGVEKLPDRRFCGCMLLARISFSAPSSLKQICGGAFESTCLMEICIPESVEELCDKCFCGCDSLSRVTFVEGSSLKRIGKKSFANSRLSEIQIPDNVEELCDDGFEECKNLSSIVFGKSLKSIGSGAFRHCIKLSEIHIPDSVEELGDNCFSDCKSLSHVTFGKSSSLKRIGSQVFTRSGLDCFSLPPGVVSIGGSSFSECPLNTFVISDGNVSFTVVDRLLLSKDCRICYGCIGTVEEVVIPDSVEELCDNCFSRCRSLSHVTFNESSSLKRIGIEAFLSSGLVEFLLPDSVEELCDRCFAECLKLCRVTSSESSSLSQIGKDVFYECWEME